MSRPLFVALALAFGSASLDTAGAANAALLAEPNERAVHRPAMLLAERAEEVGDRPAATRQPIIVLGEPEIVHESHPQTHTHDALDRTKGTKRPPHAGSKHVVSNERQANAAPAAKDAKDASEPLPLRWVCGNWEALWQGSGQGRSCEWRR